MARVSRTAIAECVDMSLLVCETAMQSQETARQLREESQRLREAARMLREDARLLRAEFHATRNRTRSIISATGFCYEAGREQP